MFLKLNSSNHWQKLRNLLISHMHPTKIIGCHHFKWRPSGPRSPLGPPTKEGEWRVELMTDGRAWYERDDGSLREIEAGDLLWHQPGDRSICKSDNKAPYTCLSVRFELDAPHPPCPVPRHTSWHEMDRVRTFIREVLQYTMDPRFDRTALLHYCYGRLLFQAQRSQHLHRQPDLPLGLAKVIERMRSRYYQECSIPAMAALAGYSQSHLHALFKEHFQITPHQFLLERRLLAARQELSSNDDELATVARRCGFADAAAFCRAFKRATRATPQQWRQKERAQW